MLLQNKNPTKTVAWQKIEEHFKEIQNISMQEMFERDKSRVEIFHIKWDKFLLDYSKNRINQKTINLLVDLANEMGLKNAIETNFLGKNINKTEDRAVLHTALRANQNDVVLVDGKNIIPEIFEVKNKIKLFSEDIISGSRKGFTGKSFTDVVNIGIGGSDLGPAMVVDVLKFYKNHLNVHFISNIDGDHVSEVIKKLNPETTLFVIVSKTFATQETLTNAETIKNWFLKSAKQKDISSKKSYRIWNHRE
jgi:glucose-6-phosphate isomerase